MADLSAVYLGTISAARIALCLLLAVACLPAVAQQQPAAPVDPIQANRERLARDHEHKADQLKAAVISLRTAPKSAATGAQNTSGEIEVLGRLRSGEEIVIDRLPGDDVDSLARVINDDGLPVGFFRTWTTREGGATSARGSVAMYFVGPRSTFRRNAEFKCSKYEKEGVPLIAFSNARWQHSAGELEFGVRASCYRIGAFGAAAGSKLLHLGVDSAESFPTTEEQRGLLLTFDAAGEIIGIDYADTRDTRRQAQACHAEGKTTQTFIACGPDSQNYWTAHWRFGDRLSTFEMGGCKRSQAKVIGPDFMAIACSDRAKEKGGIVDIELGGRFAAEGIHARLSCEDCQVLTADRLAFDPARRELTMNIETDAKILDFEGGKLQVPVPSTNNSIDDRATIAVPVFVIRFNKAWQIVEVAVSRGGSPPAQ